MDRINTISTYGIYPQNNFATKGVSKLDKGIETIGYSNFNGFIVRANERESKLLENHDEKSLKKLGIIKCQTCASRVYQDGSNDASVSFKSPTHLSPEQASGAVRAHEQEHVTNEQQKATESNRKVVSQSVQIFTDTCPECGTNYVSGGVTKTVTKGNQNPYHHNNSNNRGLGELADVKV